MAMGQNLRYLFGVGYHPTIVFLKGFLGVHWGTGVLTHSHIIEKWAIDDSGTRHGCIVIPLQLPEVKPGVFLCCLSLSSFVFFIFGIIFGLMKRICLGLLLLLLLKKSRSSACPKSFCFSLPLIGELHGTLRQLRAG